MHSLVYAYRGSYDYTSRRQPTCPVGLTLNGALEILRGALLEGEASGEAGPASAAPRGEVAKGEAVAGPPRGEAASPLMYRNIFFPGLQAPRMEQALHVISMSRHLT
jgi:hypothetical protein